MNVQVSNRQNDLLIGEKNIQDIVTEVVTIEKQQAHEISINFVSPEEISRLHDEYFGDPSFTDCISFPMDGPEETEYRVLGDIFICPKAAIQHGGDPYEETTLYLIHSLLHLMGYRDKNVSDITIMRMAESRHMANLKKKNLLLSP